MPMRAPLLATALALLAIACSEDELLPPLEEHPPPFAFSLYVEDGKWKHRADVLLVRRPKHLEHVYRLSQDEDASEHVEASELFGFIEKQFERAGAYVAHQVVSLRCAAVELPDCVPKWSFIEELLGPGDGPGALRLRQTLAASFEETARHRGLENTLVLATVNVLLTRGMVKSALGNATTAEARTALLAKQRANPPAQLSGPLAPSPGLVQALTGKNPTPQVAPGARLPQDAAVKPNVPPQRPATRPIGPSPSQNAQLQTDIRYLDDLGAKNIRVNQRRLAVVAISHASPPMTRTPRSSC